MPEQKHIKTTWLTAMLVAATVPVLAETPKLNIRTKHGFPMEEQRKAQMERLAKQYDLAVHDMMKEWRQPGSSQR